MFTVHDDSLTLFPNSSIGEPIIDRAYGPLSVRPFKNDHPTRARINADNYRWYVQVSQR